MYRLISRRRVLELALLLALFLPAHSPAADRFRVAYSALNASQSYLWVAQDAGLYAKHGLDVDLLYINSGSTSPTVNVKSVTEAIWTMKRHRPESERIIGKYMKMSDPQLIGMEYDFVISLLPDYAAPTIDGVRLILENFGNEFPNAARRDPKEFIDGSLVDRLKHERFVEGLKS